MIKARNLGEGMYSIITKLKANPEPSFHVCNLLMRSDQSLDRIPSSRNLTSFKTLLEGFQSSNCRSNSVVSSWSSRRTYSSSKRPRIAKGRMYGFGVTKPLDRLMLSMDSGTEDVSRANAMAILKSVLVSGYIAGLRYIRVYSFVVVESRMSFSCV